MLTSEEKKLLEKVLDVTGENESMIGEGIKRVLRGYAPSHGENGKATRKHLWCVLPGAAKEKIRRLQQKMPRLIGL